MFGTRPFEDFGRLAHSGAGGPDIVDEKDGLIYDTGDVVAFAKSSNDILLPLLAGEFYLGFGIFGPAENILQKWPTEIAG